MNKENRVAEEYPNDQESTEPEVTTAITAETDAIKQTSASRLAEQAIRHTEVNLMLRNRRSQF